jgi:hypothetical protein
LKKTELETKTNLVIEETRIALQTVFNALNQGQQKKLLKEEAVKELFDRYCVKYDEVVSE